LRRKQQKAGSEAGQGRIFAVPPFGVRRQSEAATALWLRRSIGPMESAVAASLCRRTPQAAIHQSGGTNMMRPLNIA